MKSPPRLAGLTAVLAAVVMTWLTSAAAAAKPEPPTPEEEGRRVLVLLRAPPAHYTASGAYGGRGYGDSAGRAARRRVADRLAREYGLTVVTDWPMPLLGLDCFVMAAPPGRSVAEEAANLSRDPAVAASEPMHVYRAQGAQTPRGDPLLLAQPATATWRLIDLHEMSKGRGVMVAVVDSQVETTHPDLLGQVAIARSFVAGSPSLGEDHGTGVAGIIAAREGNGLGIAGIAPEARLMALRACWQVVTNPSATVCDSLSLAEALHFAIDHQAQVINLSLSGPSDLLLGKLIDVATARGTTVVGAWDASRRDGGFPASHKGVVAVSDEPVDDGARAGLYTAPGRDVPTTQTGGRWSLVNGSSFAAAHVSGLAALADQRRRRGHGSHQAGALAMVATPGGHGAIDACATLLRALGPCDCGCAHGRRFGAAEAR